VKQEEPPGNVYALFPGIDTTPFGDASSSAGSELGEAGWSAVPTRPIAPEHSGEDGANQLGDGSPPVRSRRHARVALGAPVVWMAVALIAGAAFAAGRAMLTQSAAPAIRHGSATSEYRASLSQTLTAIGKLIHATPSQARHAPATHSTKPRTSHTQPVSPHHGSARTSTVTVTVAAPPPSQPSQTVPVYANSAHASQAETSGSAAVGGTPPPPAGPTGRVSLIGAGTTPSG
jgi:hypothetical protein